MPSLPKQGSLALQVPATPMSWNLSVDDGTRIHQLSLGQAIQQGYNVLVDGHDLVFQVAFAATGVVSYKVCEWRISTGSHPAPVWAALSPSCCRPGGKHFQARARADAKLLHCWAELVCVRLLGFAQLSLNCLAQGNGEAQCVPQTAAE